jgi:maltose O-acetyltransferase
MVDPVSEMKRRMLAGALYIADDPELLADAERCALLVQKYNATRADDGEGRTQLLGNLLGRMGTES